MTGQSIIDPRRVLTLVALIAAGLFVLWWKLADPGVHLLRDTHSAQWILHDRPFEVVGRDVAPRTVLFRQQFHATRDDDIRVSIQALKVMQVYLDGEALAGFSRDPADWKRIVELRLGALEAGEHELTISVSSIDSPPAVIVSANHPALNSGEDWRSRDDAGPWQAVRLATQDVPVSVGRAFPSVAESFLATLPFGLAVLALTLLLCHLGSRRQWHLDPGMIRYGLLVLWFLYALNSLARVMPTGFDVGHHLEYIDYIAWRGSLPLANDGLQMFQSPLFYVLGAALFRLGYALFEVETAFQLVKIIPLACGVANIEIAYRCARLAFPDRRDLQVMATVCAVSIPMHLYTAHFIGNEMLAGTLPGACIWVVLRWMRRPELSESVREQLLLGGCIGAALLAKVTVIVLIVPIVVMLTLSRLQRAVPWRRILDPLGGVAATALVVAGWYYLRNVVHFGQPFVGGWDALRGFAWWQDPGYRTMDDLLTFGTAMTRPIYAAASGFWDSIYSTLWLDGLLAGQSSFADRPPWNYSFVLAAPWLAVLPTLLIGLGAITSLRRGNPEAGDRIVLFATLALAIYLAAIFFLYLDLPIYSTAKASYALGLLPCFGILMAQGWKTLLEGQAWLQRPAFALLSWWCVFAWLGYFPLN
jgi:hypothetical protein